ncbi:hypothetical protein [Clostridium septicum]|uniref:Uncharacterized protein n=1 Tax=Clostridium septicum TaxID=1504 RepID=A0A9N7JL96_CLOSE|nr:hypothetical protein [Clostridium septicum]AYE33802.1 hypothetical protein CP523_04605 [Clostridium septicum]QAS61959.1 hypothetical protein EI377_15160 [Clostridium septicum]UEC21585.1 hypothetical protein LK444_04220 [Clostridium septicum]USS00367.1 hypothetical protein NH397_12860 [Clostridium septicum]WLF68917.1 hypothetical protein Q6375_13170 [Clostridium septicum]
MKEDQFNKLIKNSLMDECTLSPEEALIETTKNLIKKKKRRDLWINKMYILFLVLICLIFSIKAIYLSIQSQNITLILSLTLSFACVLILNFIYRYEIINFLKIKGDIV